MTFGLRPSPILLAFALATSCTSKPVEAEPATAAKQEPETPAPSPAPAPPAERMVLDSDELCRKILGPEVYAVFFDEAAGHPAYDELMATKMIDNLCTLQATVSGEDGSIEFITLALQVVDAEEYEGMSARAVFEAVTKPGETRNSPEMLERAKHTAKLAREVHDELYTDPAAREAFRSQQEAELEALASAKIDRRTNEIAGLGEAGALVEDALGTGEAATVVREVYFIAAHTTFRVFSDDFQDPDALAEGAQLMAKNIAALPG